MTDHVLVFRPLQSRFLAIPQAPVSYWIPDRLLNTLTVNGKHEAGLTVSEGLGTRKDARFVRFFWEVDQIRRWYVYSKGGGYARWFGHDTWNVEWEHNGARVKKYVSEHYPPEKFTLLIRHERLFGEARVTYSTAARGSLGAREIAGAIPGDAGPGIFLKGIDNYRGLAFLNGRASSFLLRGLTAGGINLKGFYVALLPVYLVAPASSKLEEISQTSVALKRCLVAGDSNERSFSRSERPGTSLGEACRLIARERDAVAAMLHTLEGLLERLVFDAYGLDADDTAAVLDETGTPAGWFPLIQGYEQGLEVRDWGLEEDQECVVAELQAKVLEAAERRAPSPQRIQDLKRRLRLLYEAGPGAKEESDGGEDAAADEDEEEEVAVGVRIPIPAETFLEELSQKLEVHPISVYWLLAEGIEKEGWRCLPEERRIIADRFSVIILRLLGHRWPRQVEAGEPVLEWADPDGVIPLIQGTGEPTLFDRVIERAAAEYAPQPGGEREIEREFAEIMGKPLDQWLTTEFFKHHTRQFKKRPIAWQLQSGPFTARRHPAFACLVYTHKLDGTTLTTIQSQYVRPLRQRYETELRNLESIPTASRSEQQETRRVQLEALIAELHDFDAALEQVAREGFGPENLLPTLQQYAIYDAMLTLKARWLRRVSESLTPEPLATWQAQAIGIGLHPSFHQWIAEALSHLDRYCTVVGPGTADAAALPEDPTVADFAALIGPHAQSMFKASLQLACAAWWKSFEEAVLDPIDERIKDANEQIKALDTEIKQAPPPSTERLEEMQQRKKTLRAQVQSWKREKEQKIAATKRIREAIEAWDCPQALTQEPWLAAQPLYDEVASIDGKRQPPRSIKDFIAQERSYIPDVNDGVRVNIAPLQNAGLLAADVLAAKDVDKAIADRAEWQADERRWCREGKLPKPGWWPTEQAQ